MITEEEKQIILQMSEIREDKMKNENEILDLQGQIIKKKYDITLKNDKLDKLYLRLGVIRMENKE